MLRQMHECTLYVTFMFVSVCVVNGAIHGAFQVVVIYIHIFFKPTGLQGILPIMFLAWAL